MKQDAGRSGVDLGCGSGLWAKELTEARHRVLGTDISGSMIDIARRRVQEAEFQIGSLFELVPGAVFVFDFAESGQVARGITIMGFSKGEDWVVLLEKRRIERGER